MTTEFKPKKHWELIERKPALQVCGEGVAWEEGTART